MATRRDRASVNPPRQPRSAATQERILDAAEALLAEGKPELLTMEQVAERAHVSIGAIYKRFQGKSSLLPLVLDRFHVQQLERLREFLARDDWHQAGLAERIHALLTVFAENQLARQRLIRALVVGHWQSIDPRPQETRAAEMMGAMHAWLSQCAGEIHHPEPRLALSLGLFASLQTLQTAIMLERVPPDLGLPRFTAEIARMFLAYLGASCAD